MEQDRLDEIDLDTMERNRSVATDARLSGAAVKRPQITDALARVFFEEWARVGYSALSLDAVARKAGVGKAALYRRWRSKADMAQDLVSQLTATVPARIESGDRGSLEADLYAMGLAGRRLMRHPMVRRIMADLYASMEREPALAAALRPSEAASAKKVATLVERAVARGELSADIDRALATDFLIGPLYWRLVVLGERCTREQLKALARMTAAAFRAA
ncbi:TetR/AcrR family transcriptional regulator [Phenylobacterium sp.]|uniref:TetR/AcrR family transcriptional regulator n=1 Tax=Phenylobacterium sp. TaxID=1871053 RepID=UPI0025E69CAA|nr:TetR/AcrR family transcriptional regulator [Phenylobacterium sp.]